MAKLKAKSPKKATPRKPRMLVLGEAGVGKTWGALDFPCCYYIDVEGGATLDHYTDKLDAAGGAYLGPEDGADDFTVVLDQVVALASTKHDYRTLIIDSYSKLFNTAVNAELERMARAGEKSAFGNEKKPAVSMSRRLVTWLSKLDMNVILICHEKAKWADGEQVGWTFDGWDKLEYELDLSLRIVKTGPVRTARVGKSRIQEFKTGETFPWSFEDFAERYGQEVMESASAQLVLASAEQVQRVEGLAETLKLDPATKAKWFNAAGVSNWREMTSDTIDSCIERLAETITKTQAA